MSQSCNFSASLNLNKYQLRKILTTCIIQSHECLKDASDNFNEMTKHREKKSII